MSNLRDQLLKAGLVSSKQAKQVAHQQRVERKEQGEEALAQAKAAEEAAERAALEEKKRTDREREEAKRREQADRQRKDEATLAILNGWIRDATAGNRRYFFVADGNRISYLDLSDQAVRRLNAGTAAVVTTEGAVRGEFCVVDASAAQVLTRNHADRIRHWNRPAGR